MSVTCLGAPDPLDRRMGRAGRRLRHALAATDHLLGTDENNAAMADRLSSASLLNALDYYAAQPGWRTVTLLEVTQYASLMGEKFSEQCTCRRGEPLRRSSVW